MQRDVVILGSGESGMGAALLAKNKGLNVFVSDSSIITKENRDLLDYNNIEWEENKHTLEKIINTKEVIKSPGIPNDSSFIKKLSDADVKIVSEIEFAFRYTNTKIIAITGSNGKTTTTNLVYYILKNAGYNVLKAGNIGVSFSKSIINKKYDVIVLELSSFQLDNIIDFRPDVAILLNITEDHLDRYNNNLQEYIKSKYLITKNQKDTDVLIYNNDDKNIKAIDTRAKKIPFSLSKKKLNPGGYYDKKITINLNNITMTINELALQGKHNIYNSMAAAIAARVFEVKDDIIRKSMIDFENIEHRLEHVLTIHGIKFINDSKATNVNACWYALESMQNNVVWIVGGVDKGNDYSELFDVVEEKVSAIICLGLNNKNIINAFRGKVKTIVQASDMNEAVRHSYGLAKKGNTVLLSPACASFDLFKNFEERGHKFKSEVRAL